MGEVLNGLNNVVKMLVRRTNAIWNIFLTSKEEARSLAGSILTTKSVRMQIEYMGIRRIKITLYGMTMDVEEDLVRLFFTNYGQVEEDIILQLTTSHKCFLKIPDTLICQG